MYETSRHLSYCTRNPWIHVWNKSSLLLLHQESLGTCMKQVVTSPTAPWILGYMYKTSRHFSYCTRNHWIHVWNKSPPLLLHPGILGYMYVTSRHLSYCTRNPWTHVWNKSSLLLLHQESLGTCMKQVVTSPTAPWILGYMYKTSRHLSYCTRNHWIHVWNKSPPLLLHPGILGYMYVTSRHLSYCTRNPWTHVWNKSSPLLLHQESLDTCMKQVVTSPTAPGILGHMYETSRHLSYCTRNPWIHVWNKSSPPIAPGILGYMYKTSCHFSYCTRNPWTHVWNKSSPLLLHRESLNTCM